MRAGSCSYVEAGSSELAGTLPFGPSASPGFPAKNDLRGFRPARIVRVAYRSKIGIPYAGVELNRGAKMIKLQDRPIAYTDWIVPAGALTRRDFVKGAISL